MPFFSVIIPVFNREDFIKKSIESVLNQSFEDYELIVIDDGSTDNTSSVIKEFTPSLQYFYQKNKGVSSARNHGIEKAQGKHICFLDSDDLWHKDKLLYHKNFIETNENIDIHQTEDIWFRNNKRVNPHKKHLKPSGWIFPQSLDLCLISPSSVCIRKEIFMKHGAFDIKLPACEDYDLWLRLTSLYEIGLIKEPLLTRHGGHEDQLSSSFAVMDRFRVYSILKLIMKNNITQQYKDLSIKIVLKKLDIMKNGAVKRNRLEKIQLYENIISSINNEDYTHIDFESLLSE